MSEILHATVEDAVELFIHGAKTLHVGFYLDNRALEKKGIKIIGEAARTIDAASSTGRDPLLSFLDHKEEGVRTVAAAALWQSHRDRAIGVLRQVDLYGITEASGLAMKILMFQGRFNPCPSDPRHGELYDTEKGVSEWMDLDFRHRVLKGEVPTDSVPKSRVTPQTP